MSGFACSICLETLTAPIRMLLCGHNYCEECLKNLISSSIQIRCPECRMNVTLDSQGIKFLARNYGLESAIEKLKQPQQSFSPKQVLSGNALDELKCSATTLMNDGNYEEALQTLKAITIHEKKSVYKILTSFDKIQCLIKLNKVEEAVLGAREIMSMIKVNISNDDFKIVFDKIYRNLDTLIKNLIELTQTDCVQRLIKYQPRLACKFYTAGNLLNKLANIGYNISSISEKIKVDEIKEYYSMMDEILKIIQETTGVKVEPKTKLCSKFLLQIGICCNNAEDWIKSIEVNNQAIGMIKIVFASRANSEEILGHCYNNVGNAYMKLNYLIKAKSCYEKALEVYRNACFSDENTRKKQIKVPLNNLERLNQGCPIFLLLLAAFRLIL